MKSRTIKCLFVALCVCVFEAQAADKLKME